MARLIDAKFAQHIANVELLPDDAGTVQWVLSHTPTVDAVPVVNGEWNIGKFNAGSETVFIECSECAAVFDVPTFVFGLSYNYCPNCGAKMDGGAE